MQLQVRTDLFQTIQFSLQKQLYFKQFSLALQLSFNIQNSSISNNQINISTQFSSIWPIDRTLSGATTSGQSGAMVMKECSAFYKVPALLGPHHQSV